MVEGQSMTVADVVAGVRDWRPGGLRQGGGRADRAGADGVGDHGRDRCRARRGRAEKRSTHRNGYRPRGWETRVGELELLIPKKRQGPAYFPSFLEPRRRSEQAIVAVVMEAYVNGVSTRKVDRLVEQLGIGGMTKDRVSALCRGLDEHVDAFRTRPLEGAYPYLWLDAKHVKVRDRGRVVSKAVVIAYAVHESGVREVLDLDVGEVESGAFWREFLLRLKRAACTASSSSSPTPTKAEGRDRQRVLACPWQRCTVHFVRDMDQHCPPRPARPRRRRPAGDLQRRGPAQASGARDPRARPPRVDLAEGLRAARRSRGRPDRVLRASRASTGPSSAARTRSSASTARSAAAATSSASSPTTPP